LIGFYSCVANLWAHLSDKEMKVANMAPDKDDIAKSTTYIDIIDGKEGSGLTQ
jgi:hypothetical protein